MPSALVSSLGTLADFLSDPQEEIYQRFYARYLDSQSLFVLVTVNSVCGVTLQSVFEYILIFGGAAEIDETT